MSQEADGDSPGWGGTGLQGALARPRLALAAALGGTSVALTAGAAGSPDARLSLDAWHVAVLMAAAAVMLALLEAIFATVIGIREAYRIGYETGRRRAELDARVVALRGRDETAAR